MKIVNILEVPKSGSLRFWGNWFGKPYDNFHHVVNADFNIDNHTLILYFDYGEICKIINPDGIVNDRKVFHIKKATKVVWQWYYYGPDPCPENLCTIEYSYVNSTTVQVESYGKLKMGLKQLNPENHYAMEIL